jgi:hypothetical protein
MMKEVKENPMSPTNLSGAPRRVFKRQDWPRSFAELLAHTGFFVRVETYCPLEPPVGTPIAEIDLSLEVGYDADPVDNRGASLEIKGCFLHYERGRFWVSLPAETLSFPEPREHAIFELSVFKDLCECFPEVVPPALIRVTEGLRRKEGEEVV